MNSMHSCMHANELTAFYLADKIYIYVFINVDPFIVMLKLICLKLYANT